MRAPIFGVSGQDDLCSASYLLQLDDDVAGNSRDWVVRYVRLAGPAGCPRPGHDQVHCDQRFPQRAFRDRIPPARRDRQARRSGLAWIVVGAAGLSDGQHRVRHAQPSVRDAHRGALNMLPKSRLERAL